MPSIGWIQDSETVWQSLGVYGVQSQKLVGESGVRKSPVLFLSFAHHSLSLR